MKPCFNRRKAIAMLALDEVNGREAEELRSHLESCGGCRNYLEEISAVTKRLGGLEINSDVEASDTFHSRVMSRVRTREAKFLWEIARIFALNWRMALPLAAILILFGGIFSWVHAPNVAPKPNTPGTTYVVAGPNPSAAVAPTLSNYQMAVNQSLQKFDELLNREAKAANSAGPVYRAAELTMVDGGM